MGASPRLPYNIIVTVRAANRGILAGLAAALAGLVYLDALGNPFVYDDLRGIVDNPSIRDWTNLWAVVRAQVFRPVVNFSYAVDYALWGLRPVGFHVTGVLLHVVNALLLFRFARLAVEDAWRREGGGSPEPPARPEAVAFVTAALFAVHPVMTEAVGYASGRAEVLATTFVLLGLLAVRRALADLRPRWLGLTVLCLALGVGSKEVAVMLPVVALAYDRLLLRGPADARRRRLSRVHLPLLLLVALAGVARGVTFLWLETEAPPVAPWQYALMQLGVVWRYLGLLLLPVWQSVVHAVRAVTSPLDPVAVLAAAGLLALGALAVRLRRAEPLLGFGLAWFLLLLLPSSSLVPLNEAMAEHRVYGASAGVFLAVAAGAARASAGLAARSVATRVLARVALILVLGALSLATVSRNLVWASPVTLWQDAVRKAPEVWLPHYALGDAWRLRGNCAAAIPAYETARRLRPQEPLVYANLGACLIETGRRAEAARVLTSALAVDPGHVRAHHNLGVLALLEGDTNRALHHFVEAVNHDPRHVPSRQNLAALYETTYQNFPEALRLCEEIQRINPQVVGVDACIRRNRARVEGR